jgi:hypothetical protein
MIGQWSTHADLCTHTNAPGVTHEANRPCSKAANTVNWWQISIKPAAYPAESRSSTARIAPTPAPGIDLSIKPISAATALASKIDSGRDREAIDWFGVDMEQINELDKNHQCRGYPIAAIATPVLAQDVGMNGRYTIATSKISTGHTMRIPSSRRRRSANGG